MKSTFSTSVILIVTFVVIFAFSNISHASGEIRIEFDYIGGLGPNFWHLLRDDAAICETGKRQSPINIESEDFKMFAKSPSPKFCDAVDVESINNGNTVEISSGKEEVPLPAEIIDDGEKYELLQFHFHTPSEHRVNGKHHNIEQHLVFKSESGKISVVAIFYDVGSKASKFMKPITDDLPKRKGDKKKIKKVELSSLLKDIKNITQAFTYSGSLTTPPCTEGVTWYVNQEAQSISPDQYLGLKEIIGFNSRFTQLRENEIPGAGPNTEQPGMGELPVTDEQPSSTDPYGQPSSTDPYGQPSSTDPSSTDPNSTDPSSTDPNSTDPNSTDPNSTDPNSTDPNSTDPNSYYKSKRSLYSRRRFRKLL